MQGSACRHRHRHRHDYTLVAHQPLPPARSGLLRDTDGVITSRLIRVLFADTYLEPFAFFGVKLIGVEELVVASFLRNFFEIWPKMAFVFCFFCWPNISFLGHFRNPFDGKAYGFFLLTICHHLFGFVISRLSKKKKTQPHNLPTLPILHALLCR